MVKSLFKPLFGFPGIFSRINGFVIRSISIVLSIIIVFGGVIIGILGYVAVIAGIPYLLVNYFWIGISAILLLVSYRACFYLFLPLNLIKNPFVIDEYYGACNLELRILLNKLENGNFNGLIEKFKKTEGITSFMQISEITPDAVFNYLKQNQNNSNSKLFIEKLLSINSQIKHNSLVTLELVFVSYILHFVDSDEFLNKFEINSLDIIGSLDYANFLSVKPVTLWSDEYNLPPAGGIDKSWAVGYTGNLNKFGTDLTKLALKGLMPKLIGRQKVKDEFINILSKSSKNNVLLIGQPGCGKTTFVHGMAREIALGTKIDALRFKRIISLDKAALQSGTIGEVNLRISNIVKEILASGNIILFIDEIHTVADSSANSPLYNALEPYLASDKFQLVGTTNSRDYEKYIAPMASFASGFDIVDILESTDQETIEIIQELVKKERSVKSYPLVTFLAISLSVSLSKKYLHRSVLPNKAVELFMQGVSKAKLVENLILDRKLLKDVFSEVASIPTSALNVDERNILKMLGETLHKSVICQGPHFSDTVSINFLTFYKFNR